MADRCELSLGLAFLAFCWNQRAAESAWPLENAQWKAFFESVLNTLKLVEPPIVIKKQPLFFMLKHGSMKILYMRNSCKNVNSSRCLWETPIAIHGVVTTPALAVFKYDCCRQYSFLIWPVYCIQRVICLWISCKLWCVLWALMIVLVGSRGSEQHFIICSEALEVVVGYR